MKAHNTSLKEILGSPKQLDIYNYISKHPLTGAFLVLQERNMIFRHGMIFRQSGKGNVGDLSKVMLSGWPKSRCNNWKPQPTQRGAFPLFTKFTPQPSTNVKETRHSTTACAGFSHLIRTMGGLIIPRNFACIFCLFMRRNILLVKFSIGTMVIVEIIGTFCHSLLCVFISI